MERVLKYTSAQAAKLLLKVKQDYERIISKENNSKTFLASVGEDVESVRPDYNYEETKNSISDLETKIRKIKHAINVCNTTTVVPEFDMTIDELLVYIPQLSAKKSKLKEMADALPKMRNITYDGSNIIDYVYVNYDIDAVAADLEKITEELSNAQLALDSINHTEMIEIEI